MRDPRFTQWNAWEQHHIADPEQAERARTEGRTAAEQPADLVRWEAVYDALEGEREGVRRAFEDEFTAAVRAAPGRQAAWVDALVRVIAEERGALVATNWSGEEVRGATKLWQQEIDPFVVWDRLPEVFHTPRALLQWVRLLLRIHPARGLRELDGLPYPSLMSDILVLHCGEDRDLIEELIAAAPPVFDDHCAWRPDRSVAALFLVDLITVHASKLHEAVAYPLRAAYSQDGERDAAEQALADVRADVLPTWMKQAFAVLLRREDGPFIALGYLAHLGRMQLLGRGRRLDPDDPWNVPSTALAALVAAMEAAAVDCRQMREAWARAEQLAHARDEADAKRERVRRPTELKKSARAKTGEGARRLHGQGLPFFYGAAMLLSSEPDIEAQVKPLWTWFVELLEGRDPALSLARERLALAEVSQRVGHLVSLLPEPGDAIRRAYIKLEPQRRRALFAERYQELHRDLESVLLLRVGLHVAVHMKESDRPEAAWDLFFWIYATARRLWLTAVLDVEGTKQSLVLYCFSFVPRLFEDRLEETLRQLIPPIVGDVDMIAGACMNLRLNGLEPSRLPALFAPVDLANALRDAGEWSKLARNRSDLVARLQELSAELKLAPIINSPSTVDPKG